jgi:coenzyme F420 hydrogenase subunit beta
MTADNDLVSMNESLADIVEQAMCIGCGLCQGIAGPDAIRMEKSATGYLYPNIHGEPSREQLETILKVCPSRFLQSLPETEQTSETRHDPVWGSYLRLVHGWASDPEERFEGATGGVLTGLAAYLVESGKVDFVLHAKASTREPTFGEPQLSFSRADVIAGAGSRYGPTAVLIDIDDVLSRGQAFAFVGKPCDISALRNYALVDRRVDELVKYWMTIVCGGFMPPEGTVAFLRQHGIQAEEVSAMRYRGRGFPGPTRVETRDGRVLEATYYDFWGENYDRWTLPHRCKICPDSIGEGADIAAADPWPGGGPDLSDDSDPGTNVIIARTRAGMSLLAAAEADDTLTLGEEATIEQMNDYQPHQVARKHTAWARFEGLKAEGRIVPETHGLRIEELAGEMDDGFIADQTAGTRRRVREGKASEVRPTFGKPNN